MPGVPSVAVGAIVAALIAGLVSLLGLIISKETKVSEFRQAWIDALREDMAVLLANAASMYHEISATDEFPTEEWRTRVASNLLSLNEASLRIRLRLNPKETESIAVLGSLRDHQDLFAERKKTDKQRLAELEERLVIQVQTVLKREWDRVRSGEPVYRIARWMAIILTAVCFLYLVGFGVWRIVSFVR